MTKQEFKNTLHTEVSNFVESFLYKTQSKLLGGLSSTSQEEADRNTFDSLVRMIGKRLVRLDSKMDSLPHMIGIEVRDGVRWITYVYTTIHNTVAIGELPEQVVFQSAELINSKYPERTVNKGPIDSGTLTIQKL